MAKKTTRESLDSVISELAKHVTRRKIPQALTIVKEHIEELETMPLSHKSAIPLLAYSAWSIDYYGPHLVLVEKAITRFRQIPRGDLRELAHLGISEGP